MITPSPREPPAPSTANPPSRKDRRKDRLALTGMVWCCVQMKAGRVSRGNSATDRASFGSSRLSIWATEGRAGRMKTRLISEVIAAHPEYSGPRQLPPSISYYHVWTRESDPTAPFVVMMRMLLTPLPSPPWIPFAIPMCCS